MYPQYQNPQYDPGRDALGRAAVMLRVVGGICLGLGSLSCLAFTQISRIAPANVMALLIGLVVVSYILPGVLYIAFAGAVRDGKRGMIIATMIIVIVHAAYIGLNLVWNLAHNTNPIALLVGVVLAVLLGVTAAMVGGCKKYAGLGHAQRGFDVTPTQYGGPAGQPPQFGQPPYGQPGQYPQQPPPGQWPDIR